MLDTPYSQIGAAIAVVVVAFAFLKGDEPERIGAGAYALGSLAALLVQDDSRLYGPQWGMMVIDAILLGAYAALAWKSRRAWPVWVSALQSLVVMTHVLMLVDLRLPLAAFLAVINLASYGILAALVLGVVQAIRERRALGFE